MENEKIKPMSEENTQHDSENLDKLLSLRGKPFADWKEERKYLRDKWGMQGQEMNFDTDKEEKETTHSEGKGES
jgi:hypothetical protein